MTLPGQFHPEQYHEQKEETFHVLHGEVELILNGQSQIQALEKWLLSNQGHAAFRQGRVRD